MCENTLSLCKVLNLEKSKNMSDKKIATRHLIRGFQGCFHKFSSCFLSDRCYPVMWLSVVPCDRRFFSAVMLELTDIPSYCDSQEQWPSLLTPKSPLGIPAGCYRLRWVAGDRSADVVAISVHLLMVG